MSGPTRCGSAPLDASSGYLEVGHQLVQPHEGWGPRELLVAARKAESGWAIGMVYPGSDAAPKPTAEGAIEARIRHWNSPGRKDYWILGKGGGFYCANIFGEDYGVPQFGSSEGHPDRMLWFDIRIWRIAEALLHSANLYRALGVKPDQPYALSLNHHGLNGREFYASEASYGVRRGFVSSADHTEWRRILTQDQVRASLRELVVEIADDLFVRFEYTQVSSENIVGVVEQFLDSLRNRV